MALRAGGTPESLGELEKVLALPMFSLVGLGWDLDSAVCENVPSPSGRA